jgi:deoxyribonuclease I
MPPAVSRIGLILAVVLAASAAAEHDDDRQAGRASQASDTAGARIIDYHSARLLLWGTLYAQGGETLYCGQQFGASKGKNINIEHVFPMSWVAWHLSCGQRKECRHTSDHFNLIEADLHNLWPSLKNINKARSSHPYAMIKGEKHLMRGCDFEVDEGRRVVEPRPSARGEIARSMFYMANEYGLQIRAKHGRTLKLWSRKDVVSAEEKRRNDVIEKIQGNRNPYIDNPALADNLRF